MRKEACSDGKDMNLRYSMAKQAFTIRGKGNKVSISCDNGIFTGVDTGLVKYHFELGAGKDNFEWE